MPLTAAGIGGAAWAVVRRRRRRRRLPGGLDLNAARQLVDRELGDVTDRAQAAGRTTRRLAKSASKSALPPTKRFLKARAKEAKGATKSAGATGGRFLKARARDLQSAIPERDTASPATKLGRRLAAKAPIDATKLGRQLAQKAPAQATDLGRQLTEKAPSQAEDAWPVGVALLPAAAYSVARLRAGHRLPIQCSVDVAVPLEVVYDEWTAFEFLPEGSHCVTDIERTDDGLVGKIKGPVGSVEWEAEILDERDCESFAWRSVRGSDCAGLITFHRLGERLTRLELQLDVLPVRAREAIELSLHTADRRAEAALRRFKARLETLSPDAYGQDRDRDTDQTDHEDQETDQADQDEKEE